MILKADHKLFGHMILVAESRKLNMKDVLTHSLGPFPWTLANSDGSLRKKNKASLTTELKKIVHPAENIYTPSVCIIDGMSIAQKVNATNKTFTELAEAVLHLVLNEGTESERIDVVFDVYLDNSIKDAERLNMSRGAAKTPLQYRNIAGGHNIRQWREFLCCSQNKMNLIKFRVEYWKL